MGESDPKPDAARRLRGKCVLIVEDEYFIADDLAKGVAAAGIDIVGPVSSLAQAVALVEERDIDGAVLDIGLSGEQVYPAADALIGRSVPIVFVTGYDASVVPARFSDVPRCEKPVSTEKVIKALGRAFA